MSRSNFIGVRANYRSNSGRRVRSQDPLKFKIASCWSEGKFGGVALRGPSISPRKSLALIGSASAERSGRANEAPGPPVSLISNRGFTTSRVKISR